MSYVEMEKHVCEICGNQYDTGSILLHRQMRNIKNPLTGTGICPACEKLKDEEYIALIEVINKPNSSNTLKQEEANRTGTIMHIRRHVFQKVFNVPDNGLSMVFVEPLVIKALKQMMPEEKES